MRREKDLLKADLHIHTKYSMDCQTPLDKIISRCQELGINCIAIADHGTAEGGLEMQKIAPFKVIVAEEILTTEGEIMGMFLKETIPSGITPQEAIKRIREQDGLVNIPHPFETIRGSALKDKVIDEIAKDIDLMEVMNSRSPFPASSNKAREFAAEARYSRRRRQRRPYHLRNRQRLYRDTGFQQQGRVSQGGSTGKNPRKKVGHLRASFQHLGEGKGQTATGGVNMAKRYKIGWFSTGRGAGSKGMLQGHTGSHKIR